MNTTELCNALCSALSGTEHETLAVEACLALISNDQRDKKILAVIPTNILLYMAEYKLPSDETTFGECFKLVEQFLDLSIKRFEEKGLGNALDSTQYINEIRLEVKREVQGES